MSKHCIIFGLASDIARQLIPLMEADGWTISGTERNNPFPPRDRWDMALVALGKVAPVGLWMDLDSNEWEDCVESNLMLPVWQLREVWKRRNPGCAVCFMAGSNPNKPMAGYSAYNAGKMALLKVCEQLDFETPDAKFFALGPGYVPTKIHRATIEQKWPNERIERGDKGTPIGDIYACLKWALEQDKAVIGGRNICVSDKYGPDLAERLRENPALFKLRRVE